MSAPRLEIDLAKIHHNAHELVRRLAAKKISITGVTKAALGSFEVADTMLQAGVSMIGDSRIENMRAMGLPGASARLRNAPRVLIRAPMLSQAAETVRYAGISCNTEIAVINALSLAASTLNKTHRVILMVELGDLREGIMPEDLHAMVRQVLALPGIRLLGIGTNLACRSGVSPDAVNMGQLSALAESVEALFGIELEIVSGGNSANLNWALAQPAQDIGRINNLRLGEAILLGRETLQRVPIEGLHTDAISLFAEVIESKLKPSQPSGNIAQAAFGNALPAADKGPAWQAILAIGRQDIDPAGLTGREPLEVLAASSDHLVVRATSERELVVGEELAFDLDYSALLRAMTSPYVSRHYKNHVSGIRDTNSLGS